MKSDHIGTGAYGKVYKYTRGDEAIAVKTMRNISDKVFERMETEIRALQALAGHENILKYLHHSIKDHKMSIYMELCSESLSEFVKKNTLSIEDILHIIMQASVGLTHGPRS